MFSLVSKSKKRRSAGLTLGFGLAASAVELETDTVRGIQYQRVVASWHTTSTVNLCWPSSRLRMHKDQSASAKMACQRPRLPLAVCVFREGNVPAAPDWWQRAKAWHRSTMQQLLNIYMALFSFYLNSYKQMYKAKKICHVQCAVCCFTLRGM